VTLVDGGEIGKIDLSKCSSKLGFDVTPFFDDCFRNFPTYSQACKMVDVYGGFLHPRYTLHYKDLSFDDFFILVDIIRRVKLVEGKLIFIPKGNDKHILENVGCVHKMSTENIVVEYPWSQILLDNVVIDKLTNCVAGENIIKSDVQGSGDSSKNSVNYGEFEDVLQLVNSVSKYPLKDKSGVYVGARMGRPEKAKLRHMKGSPHGLFPVGKQGGRMKSLVSAHGEGFVESQFKLMMCEECGNESIYNLCEKCGGQTKEYFNCPRCGKKSKKCGCKEGERELGSNLIYKKIDMRHYFKGALKILDMNVYPELIKGVEKVINRQRNIEHLSKAILRAKHDIYVNKDGTIRYDASEMTLTHFKPIEIGTSVSRLVELGYTHDCYGKELVDDEQICEIKPQDCVLPACNISPNERADDIMFRTMQFVDELLVKLYGMKPYYNAQSKEECVGQYLIGLAPHTSAGILMRCIGFTNTQGFHCHPLLHCAMRRDVDGDETCFFLLLDGFLNFSQKYLPSSLGGTMDAPLVLTSNLNPKEVDDMSFDCDIVWKYPLEFYRACEDFKMPWDIKLAKIEDKLGTPFALEGMGFTHDFTNINQGVVCSAYKTLPTMQEKLFGQMNIAKITRAVVEQEFAGLVMNRHFLKDIKGNLRKFSHQTFRCVKCNTIYRRPPLCGYCTNCKGGKVIFTVSPGSVVKYVDYCLRLADEFEFDTYFAQTIELMKLAIDSVFGKEKEIQTGLGAFM